VRRMVTSTRLLSRRGSSGALGALAALSRPASARLPANPSRHARPGRPGRRAGTGITPVAAAARPRASSGARRLSARGVWTRAQVDEQLPAELVPQQIGGLTHGQRRLPDAGMRDGPG